MAENDDPVFLPCHSARQWIATLRGEGLGCEVDAQAEQVSRQRRANDFRIATAQYGQQAAVAQVGEVHQRTDPPLGVEPCIPLPVPRLQRVYVA